MGAKVVIRAGSFVRVHFKEDCFDFFNRIGCIKCCNIVLRDDRFNEVEVYYDLCLKSEIFFEGVVKQRFKICW